MAITVMEMLKAEKNGISKKTAEQRIHSGWDRERALTHPKTNWKAVCKQNGISYQTYNNRRDMGWEPEEAATTPVDKRFRRNGPDKWK